MRIEDFDLLYSGTTGVIVIAHGGFIYSASVGDSRALLGTCSPPSVLPVAVSVINKDRKILEEIRVRRGSKSSCLLSSVQLTKDQKPEDPEELARIIKCGGRVQRLIDENGNRIGPYRVWENNTNTPGLAMSRSIGDVIGKKLGVISTPILTKHEIDSENDFFVVIATDGVWDVMENEDVVNFVECFREKCKHGNLKNNGKNVDIEPKNACISQLLCEESRIRWYKVVEEDDVVIDDISCVVLELKKGEFSVNFQSARLQDANESVNNIENDKEIARAPSITEIITRDPRRGSHVTDKTIVE